MADSKEAQLAEALYKVSLLEREKEEADAFSIGSAPQEVKDGMFRDYDGETLQLDQQIERANALRDTPASKGVHAGSAFVAANPWSVVGDVMKQGAGIYQGNKARDERSAVTADRASTQQGLAEHRFAQQQAMAAKQKEDVAQQQQQEFQALSNQLKQTEALRAQQMQPTR